MDKLVGGLSFFMGFVDNKKNRIIPAFFFKLGFGNMVRISNKNTQTHIHCVCLCMCQVFKYILLKIMTEVCKTLTSNCNYHFQCKFLKNIELPPNPASNKKNKSSFCN